MQMAKFSSHAITARLDRMTFISINIGFGEVVAERNTISRSGGECLMQLTSTGVIIVKGKDDGTIVTMYLATISVAKTFYEGRLMPKEIFSAVSRNQRKGWCNMWR